jgi:hypothetical protein
MTTEIYYTATVAIDTPRGRRWQGVTYAGHSGPRRYANESGERLPRGAQVRYRSPRRIHAGDAYELARSRTIHHNLYHSPSATWPAAEQRAAHVRAWSGYHCPEKGR